VILTRMTATRAGIILSVVIVLCAIYANLSFFVASSADYRYFPPFTPNVDANQNKHLGAEYFNMARALRDGEGFANPFTERTGPSAWQPPVFPVILAGLLWIGDGNRDAVTALVVFLQVFVLIGTGLLVLSLTRRTCKGVGAGTAAVVFVVALLCHFQLCFQWTHDSWLVLLALDVLIAGLCWGRPLSHWLRAVAWGLYGGLCALINPVVGFTWGATSLLLGFRERAWSRLLLAALFAGLALAPWMVRNYQVFGRLIPVKANLAYELYQSQCLQSDGLLQGKTFDLHPYHANTRERQEYKRLGEVAFLEKKREQFWASVEADPLDYLERVGRRAVGATLWYEPFWDGELKRPWALWMTRLTYPLPFLGLMCLIVTARRERLSWAQWSVIGVYFFYLLPYLAASYYERYALPLLGVKTLLVIWATDRLLALWRGKRPLKASVRPQRKASSHPGTVANRIG
jgi:hypothetical protein